MAEFSKFANNSIAAAADEMRIKQDTLGAPSEGTRRMPTRATRHNTRHNTRRTAWATAFRPIAALLAGIFGCAGAASAAPPLVTFAVTSSWDGGYNGEIHIENRANSAIASWQLGFDNGPVISSLWNGTHMLDGVRHTVTNAGWNGLLAPGATVIVGFGGVGTLAQNVLNCVVSGLTAEVAYAVPGGGSGGGAQPAVEAKGPFWAPEDIDGDRMVGAADLAALLGMWGSEGEAGPLFSADVNRDGVVDAADLGQLLARWGALPDEKRIVGYWIEWGIYGSNYQPMDTPFEKLTHLNYAFAKINPDYTIAPFDTYAATDKNYPGDTWDQSLRGCYNQINNVHKRQHPHLKTLISIGGWTLSGLFSDAALTDSRRTIFADSCVEFLRTYGFDGIDIDWEYPCGGGLDANVARPEDKQNFTLLLAKIREKLNAAAKTDGRAYLLTVAVGAGLDKIANTEVDAYHEHLDWINVMSYDFFGAWDLAQTGHHAGFEWNPAAGESLTQRSYNARTAIDAFLAAGVPSGKIVPGLAFYGRAWSGVPFANNGLFQPASAIAPGTWDDWSSGLTGVNDFTQIEAFITTGGYARHWDPIAKAVWAYHPTQFGGHFISYEDAQSIGVKADYLREHDLGGFMFWEVTADRNETLLNTVVDELGGRR